MKKQLTFFFFSLILGVSLQNCKFAKIDSVANDSFEVGFRTINAKARIIDYKDGTPTAHGHCYSSTVKMPEVGLADTDTTETPFVAVDFESKIDSLIFDTEYFVRPYMRNGTQIVYGEVQKISTKTPTIVIKNLVVKDTLIFSSTEPLISVDIVTNEPLIVPPFPNNVASREYGFVFGKADTLRIDNGFPSTTNPNILDIRLPSLNTIANSTRNFRLGLRTNDTNFPNRVAFFNAPANTNFAARAYIKLNKDGVVKYYYTSRVAFKIN